MTTFREVMSIVHADRIILHCRSTVRDEYICNGWTKKDFDRLVEDWGDAEVVRVDFHTSYGYWPEIFLERKFRPERFRTSKEETERKEQA